MQERLNLRLFTWLLAALVVSAGGAFVLHRFQVRRTAPQLRALARAAEDKGRLDRAARLLGLYLTFAPKDAKAKADYASLLEKYAATPRMRRAAIDLCEEVLVDEPDNNEVRKRLARLQIVQGHYEDALANLWRLRDASPQDPDLTFQVGLRLLRLAGLQIVQGHYEDALANLRRLPDASPQDPDLEFQVGLCQEGCLNYSEAVEQYQQTNELAPDRLVAYLRGANLLRFRLNDPWQADETMDEMVDDNPEDPQAYLLRARYRIALGKGNFEEDLRQARELADPPTADILLTSAEAAQRARHIPEALGYLREALKRYPDDARVYHALAVLEAGAGNRPEVIAHLREGVARLPGNRGLLFTLATVLIEGRDFEKAAEVIAELTRWKTPPQHLALLKAELSMARGEWKEAREALEPNRSLLAADSPELVVHADLLLGRCYERLGEAEADPKRRKEYSILAWSAYRRALGANPQHLGAQAALAQVLVRLGRTEDAIGQYRRLLAKTDAGREAWLAYAKLLVSRERALPADKRQWQEVKETLDRIAEKVPDDAEIALLRAEVCVAQNKSSEAQGVLKDAAARHPKTLVALVQYHLSLGQVKEAETVVREAKRQLSDPKSQVPASEVLWTRRTLATYLADSGHESLFREALDLIEQNLAAEAGSAADIYAKARILGSRPSHRQAALALLLRLGRQKDLSPEQQVYLARLYLGTGNRPAALAVIRDYGRSQKATPEERLACLRSAAEVFEQFAHESPAAGKDLYPAAEELYRKAADAPGQPKDALVLAGYLGRRHRPDEALEVCVKARGRGCPPEKVAASAMMIGCAGPASPEQLDRIERFVRDCVEQKPDSPVLSKLLAIVQARRGRYPDAADSYRAVLKRNPRDVDALNNLALMLTLQERPPAKPLELLEKAVELAGPTAGLIDTRGVVYLQAGDLDSAIRDLSAAVAQGPTPVRHLHLAQAYLRKGKREEARQAFTKARAAGVERSLVLPAEDKAYQQLCQYLDSR